MVKNITETLNFGSIWATINKKESEQNKTIKILKHPSKSYKMWLVWIPEMISTWMSFRSIDLKDNSLEMFMNIQFKYYLEHC